MNRILSLVFAGLAGCAKLPPLPATAPSGAGWVAYNQSYHLDTATATSTTYTVGSTSTGTAINYTVTTATSASETHVNAGTPLESWEEPACGGYGWLRDCPAFHRAVEAP